MADKKEQMLFTISLRDAWKVAYKKRAKKCMAIIRGFAEQHMKASDVKIGQALNEAIWARGPKSPPREIKVQAVPHEEEVWIELADVKLEFEEKEKKSKIEALKERIVGKAEKKGEEIKEKKIEELKEKAPEKKEKKEEPPKETKEVKKEKKTKPKSAEK